MTLALLVVGGMFGGALLVLLVLILGGWLGSHNSGNNGAETTQTGESGKSGHTTDPGAKTPTVSTTPTPSSPVPPKPITPTVPDKPVSTPTETAKAPEPKPMAKTPALELAPVPRESSAHMVDDLKVTQAKLSSPFKLVLPCLLWANAAGSAFFTLEPDTGFLCRVSFPDLQVAKHADLKSKFTWMSLSAEGLVLTETDSGMIWLLDPASLAEKKKIEVPGLQRAVSAPGISKAVATTQVKQSQRLYLIDLAKGDLTQVLDTGFVSDDPKHTVIVNVVPALKPVGRVQNPAISPDGGVRLCRGGLRRPAPLL